MTDGERWARELLVELRAARFAPGAWLRFLRSSFVRAGEARRIHRREHRQALALGAAGFAAWGGIAIRWPLIALVGAGWWLLVALMLDWHVGMLERPDGSRPGGLGVANVLSVLRIGAAPALFALPHAAAASLLLAAGASDVLDGVLARVGDRVTRLGRWLDGASDTIVLGAAALAAPLPGWAVGLVLVRCGVPWLAVATSYFARGEAPTGAALVSGRYPGLVLFTGISLALLELPGATELTVAGAAGGLATFSLTVVRWARLQVAPG